MNKVTEDTVPCLLSVMGPKTYGLLRTLMAPDKPKDKTIEQIYAILKDHLSPKPLTIAERFRFYKRDQKAGESVSDFITVIKRLAETCEFGDFLNTALRDKFVFGIANETIQKKLLTESNLTFQKGQNMAVAMDIAIRDSQELAQSRTTSVHKVSSGERPTKQKTSPSKQQAYKNHKKCFRCGSEKHNPEKCFFKDKTCFKCDKKGHTKVMCKEKRKRNYIKLIRIVIVIVL